MDVEHMILPGDQTEAARRWSVVIGSVDMVSRATLATFLRGEELKHAGVFLKHWDYTLLSKLLRSFRHYLPLALSLSLCSLIVLPHHHPNCPQRML